MTEKEAVVKGKFKRHLLAWLVVAAVITGSAVVLMLSGSEPRPLKVVSYGGEWQDVLRKAVFVPFMQANGYELEEGKYDGDYPELSAHSYLRNPDGVPDWDLVDAEANMVLMGKDEGILEPIDYSIVTVKGLNAAAKNKYGVGNVAWSFVLAYNTDAFGDAPPENWKDFFDLKKFPGSRSLRNDPRRTLEVALLADGVNPLELYPLDVERALAKMDRLMADLRGSGSKMIWWTDFATPPQLLATGEVAMSSVANGRLAAAMAEKKIPVSYTWKGGIMNLDFWVVMKNTPNKRKAMEFLNIASSPESQSEVAVKFFYGPSNDEAFALIPEDVRKLLPNHPDNLKEQIFFDSEWWLWYGSEIQKKWDEWIKKYPEN